MELTLPPGRHETIEKQDPVHQWRVGLAAWLPAGQSAGHVDWHQLAALVQRGCPPGSRSASSADTGRPR